MLKIKQRIELLQGFLKDNPTNLLLQAEIQCLKEQYEIKKAEYVKNMQNKSSLGQMKMPIEMKKAQNEIVENENWYSEELKENFEWNKEKHILIFENGAIYTEREIKSMAERKIDGNFRDVIHTIKTNYSARWIGDFKLEARFKNA